MMDVVYVSLGLVILLLAGDSLVKGAVNLSLRIGIPALIVSLTVVAFGTSAPELLISVQAVMQDLPGLAIGNAVGSNTANILMVLGVPALIASMRTSQCDTRHSYIQMIAASVLFIALAMTGVLTWWSGLILLGGLAAMLGHALKTAMCHRRDVASACSGDDKEVEGADPSLGWPKILMFLALGLVGLPLGSKMLIEGAVGIATRYGLPEEVIGLTLVAVGTSLPELATTVMAAIRRQADVALGNVIGSNMFNLLAIMGIAALVGDIPVAPHMIFDLFVMLGASLLLMPFVFMAKDITRVWGVALSALYVAYIWVLL